LQAHLFRGTAFRFFLCLLLWRGSADMSVPVNPSNSELRNWIDPLWQAWLLPFFISHQTASWWRRPLYGVEHVDDELSHVHHGVLEVGKYYVHRTRQLVEQVQSLQNSGKQHVVRADGYQFQRYGTTTGGSPSLCCSADTGSMTYSRMSTVEHGVAPQPALLPFTFIDFLSPLFCFVPSNVRCLLRCMISWRRGSIFSVHTLVGMTWDQTSGFFYHVILVYRDISS